MYNNNKSLSTTGYFIPYKHMEPYEIDNISNKNMTRTFCSFITLVVLFLLFDSLVGYDIDNSNYGILIILLAIAIPALFIFCMSFYGRLRVYCYISEEACPQCCQKCFVKCCINPELDVNHELIDV